uniref:general transcription factor IIH subunit 5 isoform X1 n=1 Tax=Pristiophorus japonicus TaxID=55135 RepID=UPI00398EAAE3
MRKDVKALEKVQKRFMRIIPGMRDFSYVDRLEKLGLFSLGQRRLRGDLIVFKIMRGLDRGERNCSHWQKGREPEDTDLRRLIKEPKMTSKDLQIHVQSVDQQES